MSDLRYRMIPQEVLETDYHDTGDSYRAGVWREWCDFPRDAVLPDFEVAEKWIISPEEDVWVVLANNGMYRMASPDEDRACREWIK